MKTQDNTIDFDLEFSIVELEDVAALPETAASSASTSCSLSSTCGSTSSSTT
ncbi:thiazolylpeptide-type bacteriocin [Shouchella sp. 1P09AA]|uniref:thiazolylpeptide-type bacteriocin n=1 Tax=unclassified Shouchella TaxID=2893065 RepID=UPI00399F187F